MAPREENLRLEALLAHQSFLSTLARHLVGNEHDADDLVQETWLASLQSSRGARSPRAWLGQVARNRWSHRRGAEKARLERERRAARPEAVQEDLAEQGLALRKRVLEAVQALPEPYLTTIYLRYYEEQSIADVGKRMGVPAETARSRIQRGIELLRAKLDREFGSRGSWMALVTPWCGPSPGMVPALPSLAASAVLGVPVAWLGLAAAALGLLLLLLNVLDAGAPDAALETPQPLGTHMPGPRGSAARSVPEPASRTALEQPAVAAAAESAASSSASAESEGTPPAEDGSHRADTYNIHGRVLRPGDLPAVGARVLYWDHESTTDEEGRFEMAVEIPRVLHEGRVVRPALPMIARLPGYRPAVVPDLAALLSDDPAAPQRLELMLGEPPRTLTGQVLLSDGKPARGWKVCLRNPTFGRANYVADRTLEAMASGQLIEQDVDDQGRFSLAGLLDRPYDILAWDPETLLHVVEEAVPESVAHLVLEAPDPSTMLRVAGRVVSRSGAPLEGVELRGVFIKWQEPDTKMQPESVQGQPVTTDAQGRFEFPAGLLGSTRLVLGAQVHFLQPIVLGYVHELEDPEQAELVVPVRCEIVLDAQSLHPPSDMLGLEDEAGQRVQLRIPDEEALALGGLGLWRAAFLGPGPSRRSISTWDQVVTAVFYDHDGTIVERRPLQLSPHTPTVISW